MPTFYAKDPIAVLEQTVSADDFAPAYYEARCAVSPMRRREFKAGVCATAAVLVASLIPVYHSWFSTFWGPLCAIVVLLAFGVMFFFFQPRDIRNWAREVYRSNRLLSLPQKIIVFRDSVRVETERERFEEYWTDFSKCVELKTMFVCSGGRQRDLLILKKEGLSPETLERLQAHLENTFAGRYQKNAR